MEESKKTQARIRENNGFFFEAKLHIQLLNAPKMKIRHGRTFIQPEQATIIYVTKVMGTPDLTWEWHKVAFSGNNVLKSGSVGRNTHTFDIRSYEVMAYTRAKSLEQVADLPIDMRLAYELGTRFAPVGTPTINRTLFNVKDLMMVFPGEEWFE